MTLVPKNLKALLEKIKFDTTCRKSHRTCLTKKAVFKNFAIFTGKRLCRSLLFNKVAGLSAGTLLKRDSKTGIFL